MIQKYLITSPEFYSQKPELFASRLQTQLLKHRPDFVLYRDKENLEYQKMADIFLKVCSKFENTKTFLHSDISLASKLGATGVHLTSTMLESISKAKELGLEVIISTHTYEEVLKAEELGADYVTYSPIFTTPNKGKPKGVEDLKALLSQTDIKVFALGGIVHQEQIQQIEQTKSFGFASIRYFY